MYSYTHRYLYQITDCVPGFLDQHWIRNHYSTTSSALHGSAQLAATINITC